MANIKISEMVDAGVLTGVEVVEVVQGGVNKKVSLSSIKTYTLDTAITGIGTINSVTKHANGAVISGGSLIMQIADATYPGLVSTGAQTFAGDKVFSGALSFTKFLSTGVSGPVLNLVRTGGTPADWQIYVPSATGDLRFYNTADRFSINSAGNVGIGTTTPNAPLQLAQSNVNRSLVLYELANNDHQFTGFGVNNTWLRYQVGATTENHIWYAGTSSTTSKELFRVEGSGNAALNSPLGINSFATGSINFEAKGTTTTAGGALWVSNSDNSQRAYFSVNSGALYTGTASNHPIHFRTNGTDKMTLSADGSLGVGGTPSFKLDVTGTTSTKIRSHTSGATEAGVIIERTVNTPSKWEIFLRTGATDLRFYNGADLFYFSTAGIGTATDWVATSDRRLKNNITRIAKEDVLSRVSLIANIVSRYDRIDTGKTEMGFVAQELLAIAPEYVNVPDDEKAMMGVNYAKMVVPLYKVTAAIIDDVDALKAEVTIMKSKLKLYGITV